MALSFANRRRSQAVECPRAGFVHAREDAAAPRCFRLAGHSQLISDMGYWGRPARF